MKNVFLIGPASVGKSTIASLLAEKLNYTFIDIDAEFCRRIKLIPDYIREAGYAGYANTNSHLTEQLIKESSGKTVFATPSGFLVHENLLDITERNLQMIADGTSILLLPSEDSLQSVDEIVRRQLHRWNDVNAGEERERFLARSEKYKNYGDVKIYSMEQPGAIVEQILQSLVLV